MIKWFWISFLILTLTSSFNCKLLNNTSTFFSIKDNVYQLNDFNFSESGSIKLHNGWAFYPNVLLFERIKNANTRIEISESCEFNNKLNWQSILDNCNNHTITQAGKEILQGKKSNLFVSSFHNWGTMNPSIQSSTGTAVYKIDLYLPKGEFGLFQENWPLSSAGRLWVWDKEKIKLIATIGYPAYTKEETRPMWRGISTNFETSGGKISLFLEISNFHHRSGYLGYAMILSNKNTSLIQTINYHQEQMLLCGLILMVGLYNFILYFLRTKQKELLWFSLLCMVISFRVALVSRIYQLYYPFADNFEFLLKLEYLTFSLSPILFLLFIRNLLNDRSNKIFFYLAFLYPLTISLFIIFTESSTFSHYLIAAISSIFICIAFVIFEMFIKWNSDDSDIRFKIRILVLVFVLFSSAIISDVFISFGIYQWYELSGFGLVIFTFGQAALIAKINSTAWKKTDNLNLEVVKLNEDLDRKIEERTQILQKTLDARKNDLRLAKQIQNNLMSIENLLNNKVKIHTYYEPLDEVGGDIYDISKIDDSLYRIFLADATGHGVQAGLITMLIKSEYDNLKFNIESPSFILDELNKRYISKYKALNRYFTCIIIDLDFNKKSLKMASGGHPSQLFFDSNRIIELNSTGPLVGFNSNIKYTNIEYNFVKGCSLLIFTDGIFEQFNSNFEILGEERIHEFFYQICHGKQNYGGIPVLIAEWVDGQKLKDDICFMGIDF